MDITYKSVKDLLKEKRINYPDFNVFNDRGTVIKFAYWQPKGNIEFNKTTGFYCNENNHIEKAISFLTYVKNDNSDIVVTPEYSVKWDILDEIIENKKRWPGSRKLWCLGMEGISCQDLKDFKNKYEKISNLTIFMENWDNIALYSFFSCIVYLFYTSGQLICIIQLKTTAASDKWAELEAAGLSTGNTIYYFQDSRNNNCLFSFICADALNQNISIIEKDISYQKCIILHPQLNPKPLHDSFNTMRKSFLDYSKNNIRIISINWAKDSTLIRDDGHNIKIEDSYSACYYNTTTMNKLENLITHNKKKGISLGKNGHILIWHMPSNEHCMTFSVDNFDSRTLSNATATHNEPLGNVYLEYIDGIWTEQNACKVCSIDWEWLQKEFNFSKCSTNKCNVLRLQMFFSILFPQNKHNYFNLSEGTENTIFNRAARYKSEIISYRERCKYIHEELKDGNVPTKFSKIQENNFSWILSEKGNLSMDASTSEEPINVVYIDSSEKSLIEKGIIEFQNLMGESATDRILLYYWSRKGIQYYDELYNTEINNPHYTKPVDSIK